MPVKSAEVYVGDKYSIADFSNNIGYPAVKIESSNVGVAKADEDSLYITATYYDGQGRYGLQTSKLSLIGGSGDTLVYVNLNVLPEARLSEAKTYTNPDSLQLESVEFTRTFKENSVNTWQTIYLPFAIDIEANSKDFSVARLFGYGVVKDTNGDGVVNDEDDSWIVWKNTASGMTNPNEPLLVSPKYAGEIIFRAADNILAAAKNDTVVVMDTTDRTFEIVCSYDINRLAPGDNNYYVGASGALSYRSTSASDYIPYRWYYHTDSKAGDVFVNPNDGGLRQYVATESFEFPKLGIVQ